MRRHDKSAGFFNFDRPLFIKEEVVEAVTEEPKAPAAPQSYPPWDDFPKEVLDAYAEEWSKLPDDSSSESLCAARSGVSSGGTVESNGRGLRLHTEPKTRPSITLRWYQEAAIKRIFEEWDSGNNSTLLVLPTGCGKTITFGSIVYRFNEHYGMRPDGSPRRSLILAHRTELITQACDSLAVLGVEAAIEQASQKARSGVFGDPTCVVASVQSMQANERSKRLLSWDPDYFDLIITDEGHHAASKPKSKGKDKGKIKPNIYKNIFNHFTGAEKKLFVTATPDRADGANMGDICDSLAFEYPMYEAVREGWLCPIRIRWCDTGVDLRNIRTTGGDLNESDIAEAIKPHIEVLARATKKEIDDRKTLVFTPDVGSAEAFASAMESLGIKSASLSGESSDNERQDVLNAFRRGDIQLLANCALFTEGFDVPAISCVVLLRPTKSRPLYCQMVGRGTRPAPGKENLIVVDFPWVAGKHKLVKPTELFDSTKQSEERYQEAEKLLESGKTDDLMAAMKMADEVIKEKVKLRIKVTEGRVKYRRTEYDPLAVGDILGIPYRQESEGSLKKKITDKQLDILRKAKIVGAESMSAPRASLYVDKVIERWKADKATIPQVSYLIALGVEPEVAREMKFKEASATISRLKASR
jgi:superfamily II DNA or RNA helicase